MTKGCGILLLVDEDVIVEAENTEIKRSNGFGRIVKNRHPAKTCPKPAKNYQISPLPLFNSLFSQEKLCIKDFRKLGMGVEIIVKGVLINSCLRGKR